MDLNVTLWIPGMEYFKFCFEHVYDLSSLHEIYWYELYKYGLQGYIYG